jgi:hypothetical protein
MNTLITDLTWWQVGLLVVYIIYSCFRGWHFFAEGFKEAAFGYKAKEVKLYHIIWMVVDIPSIIIGRIFPFIKAILSIKVCNLKQDK